MKKLFGILLIGLALLPGLVKAEVEDITSLDTFGTDSRTATINNLEEQVISIDINWGELKYDYIYSEGSYIWEAANGSNKIMVQVNSGNVTATLDWTSAIEGVEVKEYYASMESDESRICDIISNVYEIQPDQIVYKDSTCQTVYQDGEEYMEGQLYAYRNLTFGFEDGPNQSVDLEGGERVTWTIDLVGGSLEDVRAAYATEERIIGEFTITIADNSSVSN